MKKTIQNGITGIALSAAVLIGLTGCEEKEGRILPEKNCHMMTMHAQNSTMNLVDQNLDGKIDTIIVNNEYFTKEGSKLGARIYGKQTHRINQQAAEIADKLNSLCSELYDEISKEQVKDEYQRR